MPSQVLTPTLLIGLGGTGVAVIRKFKRLYMEVNDQADQYIRLLAIDTDDQRQGSSDPLLANMEFYQLAKPDPIDVVDVLREARNGDPALRWLKEKNLPAFRIDRGAGMKRLQGHLAYFWRGKLLRKRIQEAIQPLLEANPNLKNRESGSGVRVFVVSSLCGGTGTGMFLDVAYMARDVIESGHGPKTKNFGLLFLPSTFQELRTNPAWNAIHANGYAALQELDYYMDTPFRDTKLYMPGRNEPQMDLDSAPFQYCYLVGGVNERGDHVPDSAALYERTADFLFVNVTTPVGDDLVSHAVQNRSFERGRRSKAFAAFGSFSMALPQARDMQKYLLLMGRELINDVFEPNQSQMLVPPRELFAKLDGFVEVLNLAEGLMDLPIASEFVETILSHFPDHVSNDKIKDSIFSMLQEVHGSTQKFDQQLVARAQSLRDGLLTRTLDEVKAEWTLSPGTINRASARIDSVLAETRELMGGLELAAKKSHEDLASLDAQYRRKPLVPWSKPSLSAFRTDLSRVFEERSKRKLSEEYHKALSAFRDQLISMLRVLDQLRQRSDEFRTKYKTDALRLLDQVAKAESRAFLADSHIEEETNSYREERLALAQHCRSQEQLRVLLQSPEDGNFDTTAFARELFKVVRGFITRRSENQSFKDQDRLNLGLQDAKINLRLRSMFHPPDTSSMLFAEGNEKLLRDLSEAIKNAPGDFGKPQIYPSLDQSSMTFVRIMSSFALEDLADIKFMSECYQQRKRLTTEGMYLDLPSHRRADILSLGGEDEGPRFFALASALGRIEEVGLNFLFNDERLLRMDEQDPLARREAAYDALLQSDIKILVEEMLDKRIRNLGGNENFLPDMRQKLDTKYSPDKLDGRQPICEKLRKEREAAEAYLNSLAVVVPTVRQDGV